MVGTSPAPISAAPVDTVLGRYRLIRMLGEGGMGAVYEAVHQDLGRRVAIKVLHRRSAQSPHARSRFLQEGQSASRIRHPHVADVYDVGIEGIHPYLVMEFLEGEDLARAIAREAPFSPQHTADLLIPVIAGVAAAHDQGIVHRDLKPENIFLSTERNAIRPKVLDFGISKVMTHSEDAPILTDTGAFLGSPYYVSPEQAHGAKDIDFRSDQYSLGVILYECSTGRLPIDDPSMYALIQRIVHADFPSPRQVNPSLPSAFEVLILRAMARDPAERFATTRALGRALLEFASPGVCSSYAEELSGASRSARLAHDPGETHDSWGGTAPPPAMPQTAWRRRSPLFLGGALMLFGIGVLAHMLSGPPPSVPGGGAPGAHSEPSAVVLAEALDLPPAPVAEMPTTPAPEASASAEAVQPRPSRAGAAKKRNGSGLTDFGGRH